MKQMIKSLTFGIGIGFICWLLVDLVLAFIVGIIVTTVVYFWIKKNPEKQENAENNSQKRPNEEPSLNKFRAEEAKTETYAIVDLLERLLGINIRIRVTYPVLDEEALVAIEQLINSLREVLPAAHDQYPNEDVTWQLDEVVVEYLPHILDRYMKSQRKSQETARLIELVTSLHKQVSTLKVAIDSRNSEEFASYARELGTIMSLRETESK